MKYYKKRIIKEDYTKEKYNRCWTCKNAFGGCSWSREFLPVYGWDAEKTFHPNNGEFAESYYIKTARNMKGDDKRGCRSDLLFGVYRWTLFNSVYQLHSLHFGFVHCL